MKEQSRCDAFWPSCWGQTGAMISFAFLPAGLRSSSISEALKSVTVKHSGSSKDLRNLLCLSVGFKRGEGMDLQGDSFLGIECNASKVEINFLCSSSINFFFWKKNILRRLPCRFSWWSSGSMLDGSSYLSKLWLTLCEIWQSEHTSLYCSRQHVQQRLLVVKWPDRAVVPNLG